MMNLQTRRAFLETSAGLMGLAALNPLLKGNKRSEKLAFSTLGCPDWSLKQIVDCSVENDYKGFEIRGLAGRWIYRNVPSLVRRICLLP